jgi:hypothetical protein
VGRDLRDGDAMSTTIAGHRLTTSQRRTLDELRDYLLKNGGDSWASATTSPKGDGFGFDVYQIWGRGNQATAHRRNVYRLYLAGVLRACEIGYDKDNSRLKFMPFADVSVAP